MTRQDYIIDENVAIDEFCHFLQQNENDFMPFLNSKIDFAEYYAKITTKGRLIACKSGGKIIGLICFYCNDFNNYAAYATLMVIERAYQRKGIGSRLLNEAYMISGNQGMKTLGMHTNSPKACQCYIKNGFTLVNTQFMGNFTRCYLTKIID